MGPKKKTRSEDEAKLAQVLNPALYSGSISISRDEMTRRLKKLAGTLVELKQKPSEVKSLKAVSKCLINKKLTKHKSKEVSLLTACCLSDVLRVYAPNPPFSENELKVQQAPNMCFKKCCP
jgi:sister-chromatid-cohesion protein PDS5